MNSESISIRFDQSDLFKIRRFLSAVPNLPSDTRLKKGIGHLLAGQAKRNIDEQSPDGKTKYQDLSNKYEKYKGFSLVLIGRKKNTQTRRGTTNNRGVQSGLLRKSIDWSMGTKNVVYITMIDYGKYHQFGGKKIPARPIVTIRDENKEDIMDFIELAFRRLANK